MAKQVPARNGGTLTRPDKGESMNPAGKPKGVKNRATVVKEIFAIMLNDTNPVTNQSGRFSAEELAALAILKKAMSGDVQAYKELMDSAYGKASQHIDIKTEDPIVFKLPTKDGN